MAGVISTAGALPYEGSPEPGDRFEASAAGGLLTVPEAVSALGLSLDVLEDEQGRPTPITSDPAGGGLILPESPRPLLDQSAAPWLEYRDPGCFRLLAEPLSPAVGRLPGVQKRLKTGQRLRVDRASGLVTVPPN